jgi:hypothetical protein
MKCHVRMLISLPLRHILLVLCTDCLAVMQPSYLMHAIIPTYTGEHRSAVHAAGRHSLALLLRAAPGRGLPAAPLGADRGHHGALGGAVPGRLGHEEDLSGGARQEVYLELAGWGLWRYVMSCHVLLLLFIE